MTSHWDEEVLLAEVDRVKQLSATPESAYTNMRAFISGSGTVGQEGYIRSQRELLTSAIGGLEPEQTEYLVNDESLDCDTPASTTSLTAAVQSNDCTDSGSFTFINLAGQSVTASLFFASFEVDALQYSISDLTLPSVVSLLLIAYCLLVRMRMTPLNPMYYRCLSRRLITLKAIIFCRVLPRIYCYSKSMKIR
jgi:spore coat protein H